MEVPLTIVKLVSKNNFGFSQKAFHQIYNGRYSIEDLKIRFSMEGSLKKKKMTPKYQNINTLLLGLLNLVN